MATLAGMEAASGDAVVVIDCDLQDPPELIPELLACWREGYDVVLCVGHLGEHIETCIGTERFGMRIVYSYDAPGLDGTLGAIRRAAPHLGKRFLVLYGDTYLWIDYGEVTRRWEESGLPAVMTVLRPDGRWDTPNACFDDARVTAYDKFAPDPRMRWIDYGLGGLTAAALHAHRRVHARPCHALSRALRAGGAVRLSGDEAFL
jgi:glycosyltransferase involved in cell wall biosynthesis